MHIHTFTAPNVPEAMARVRQALGENAVILSTEKVRRIGVRVTAAVEAPEEAAPPPSREVAAVGGLREILRYHRVPDRLAERLQRAAEASGGGEPCVALATALDAYLGFAPLPQPDALPLMLVGPAGAGKTVTIAKLATRAVLAGERLAIATTDTIRSGAIDQLAAFTSLLGIPLTSAPTAVDLEVALAQDAGPWLIDSPGANPFAQADLDDLGELARSVGAEPILVLPANLDAAEAEEVAGRFRRLGCRRLIATRLDATRRLGALLAAAAAADLSIAAVSITPSVAQGLQSLDPQRLSRLIWREPGSDISEIFAGKP